MNTNEELRQVKHERDQLKGFVIAAYFLINSDILKYKSDSVFKNPLFDYDKVKATALEDMLNSCDFKGWFEFANEIDKDKR